MKKGFVLCCLLCVVFWACNGLSSSSPKTVLRNFLTALEHSDIAEAKKYASADSQGFLNMISKSNNGGADVYKDQDLTVTDNVTINGDNADVEVKTKGGAGVNFHLVKENGVWKVQFTLGALFNMAKDVIKKAGTDVQKDIDDALDSIKTSVDSLP